MAHLWRCKDNLWDLILFFYPMSIEDQTQVIRFSGSYIFYALSFLAGHGLYFQHEYTIMTFGTHFL